MAEGGDAQGGRGDARASCASPLGTPLPISLWETRAPTLRVRKARSKVWHFYVAEQCIPWSLWLGLDFRQLSKSLFLSALFNSKDILLFLTDKVTVHSPGSVAGRKITYVPLTGYIRSFELGTQDRLILSVLMNWGQILGRNPDKSLKPPCYLQSPLQPCLEVSIS
jgi:hypothetical protein